MLALKLARVGKSVGVVLPKATLARLGVKLGDIVYLSDIPEGYRITAGDPEYVAQAEAADRIMKSRRAVLRDLAK